MQWVALPADCDLAKEFIRERSLPENNFLPLADVDRWARRFNVLNDDGTDLQNALPPHLRPRPQPRPHHPPQHHHPPPLPLPRPCLLSCESRFNTL